jgi:hypothetical protein
VRASKVSGPNLYPWQFSDFFNLRLSVNCSNIKRKKKILMVKISISHPLRIDEVTIPNSNGIIGMTLWSNINSLLCSASKEDIDA